MSNSILINDPTLRDGNHAIKHAMTLEQIANYTKLADQAQIDIIEVGHGNGLGASSLQLGLATYSDEEMLTCARANIQHALLGIHAIPGFAKLKDIQQAIEIGVDMFRIAAHCTEANVTEKYIDYVRHRQKRVHGVLMMSHMTDVKTLVAQANQLVSYGAEAVVIMDSAGALTMDDVAERITALVNEVGVNIGFHAHNNLNLAVANTLIAAKCGAKILDATASGLGAGAGNTCLASLVANLKKSNIPIKANITKVLELAEFIMNTYGNDLPKNKPTTIIGGLYGVCSAFEKHILKIAERFQIDPKALYIELGDRRVIAGQEDVIIDAALKLSKRYHEAAIC